MAPYTGPERRRMSEDLVSRNELNAIITGLRSDVSRLESNLREAHEKIDRLNVALFGSKFAFSFLAAVGSLALGVLATIAYAKGWFVK